MFSLILYFLSETKTLQIACLQIEYTTSTNFREFNPTKSETDPGLN